MERSSIRLHTTPVLNRDNLQQYVGQSIGTSSWCELTQSCIDAIDEGTGTQASTGADGYHPRPSLLTHDP